MIEAIQKNLERGTKLLQSITDAQYANASVAPYYSSIGCHMRHILDVFSCVFDGLETKCIDLSVRRRNQDIEQKTALGIQYFTAITNKLNELHQSDLDKKVMVKDDLGLGLETVAYTLGAILTQAHSHAIHHFASVGYIIYQLGIELPDSDFGFNPTTPKKIISN